MHCFQGRGEAVRGWEMERTCLRVPVTELSVGAKGNHVRSIGAEDSIGRIVVTGAGVTVRMEWSACRRQGAR